MMKAHAALVLTLHHAWFSMDLPDSTSDDIEVCICHDQRTRDEDIYYSNSAAAMELELHAVKL